MLKHAVIFAAIAVAAPVTAATVTVSTTLDLSQSGLGGPGFVAAFTGFTPASFTPFTLAAGDVLDYTIDFAGGQSLTLNGPGLIWPYVATLDAQSGVSGTGTLELLDSNGVAFLTSNSLTSDEFFLHFGQQFTSSAFTGGWPSTLTFYGLHYVGTLNGYDDPEVTSRTYARPELVTFSFGNVPEPATWAMLIAGFGLVGAVLRRRRLAALA